jgi:hypothetical protein
MVTPPEQNFQPQTRDTTNGPHLHTYIPRSDGSILVGGVAYVPQVTNIGATATTVPIGGMTAVPVATQPIVQPFSPYPVNFPYYIYGQAASFPPSFFFPFFRNITFKAQANNSLQTPAPVVYQQPPFLTQPQPVYQPQYGMPGVSMPQPPFGTWGQTQNEVLWNQMARAQNPAMNKRQEMKPADDDPYRMYWVRETDGTWTQRNRLTIDSGDIGDCRWYAMDGHFYAVRLPS